MCRNPEQQHERDCDVVARSASLPSSPAGLPLGRRRARPRSSPARSRRSPRAHPPFRTGGDRSRVPSAAQALSWLDEVAKTQADSQREAQKIADSHGMRCATPAEALVGASVRLRKAPEQVYSLDGSETGCSSAKGSSGTASVGCHSYAKVPPVYVDWHKLPRILINLLSNAKQALVGSTKQDKRLGIHVRRVPEEGFLLICSSPGPERRALPSRSNCRSALGSSSGGNTSRALGCSVSKTNSLPVSRLAGGTGGSRC